MKGLNEILYIQVNNEWMPIACLTDNPISESTELIPTTTADNQGWESYVAGVQSASISFDAVIPNSSPDKADYYRIRQIKRNRELVYWKIQNHINGDIDEGLGYINELSKASPADDVLTFSGTITVSGAILSSSADEDFGGGFPYVIPNITP